MRPVANPPSPSENPSTNAEISGENQAQASRPVPQPPGVANPAPATPSPETPPTSEGSPPSVPRRPSSPEANAAKDLSFHINERVGTIAAGGTVTQLNGQVVNYFRDATSHRTGLQSYLRPSSHYETQRSRLVFSQGLLKSSAYQGEIVFIVGPPSTGKYSASVLYISELLSRHPVAEIYEVPDDAELQEQVLFEDIKPNRIYLIEDVGLSSRSLVRRLLRFRNDFGAFRQLRDRLQSCRLVMTIAEDRFAKVLSEEALTAGRQGIVVIRDYIPESAFEVFSIHFKSTFGREAEPVLGELDSSVVQLLAEANLPPPKLAELASRFAEALADTSSPLTHAQTLERLLRMAQSNASEIVQFLNDLAPEERIRAVQLAYFEGCDDSLFWRISSLLHPDPRKRSRTREWFTEATHALRTRIRAETFPSTRVVDGTTHLVERIRFRYKDYPPFIRRYSLQEFPDLMRAILLRLSAEIAGDLGLRDVGPRAMGRMSAADWSLVQRHLLEWTRRGDSDDWKDLAAPTLASAYLSRQSQADARLLLEQWRANDPSDPCRFIRLATAAAVYAKLGANAFNYAIHGLGAIAHNLDISPLSESLAFEYHLESSSRNGDNTFVKYITAQSQIHELDSPEAAERKVDAYLDRISEARTQWTRRRVAFESLQKSILTLAIVDGELESMIAILCDWIRDEDAPRTHTIRLTAALIAWRLLECTTLDGASSRLIALLEDRKEAMDALAELLAATLVRLHLVRLDGARRASGIFCDTLAEFAARPCEVGPKRFGALAYRTQVELLRRMLGYLSATPRERNFLERIIAEKWGKSTQWPNLPNIARQIINHQ